MSELMRRIEGASAHVQVSWTDERALHVAKSMQKRKVQRSRTRVGAALAGGLAVAATVVLFATKLQTPLQVVGVTSAIRMGEPSIGLADGSRAYAKSGEVALYATQSMPERVVLKLEQGSARFDVVPNATRVFEVEAGDVRVRVLGTEFTVEKTPIGAHVSVVRGRVRVSWASDSAELGAGDSGDFPRADKEKGEPSIKETPKPSETAPKAKSVVESGPNWRDLAREGDYERAYGLWREQGNRADAADLMLAADVARLSRHAGESVGPLRMVVQQHRGDPRAPLAAFTLGRVLLDELGRPGEAAQAFAEARQMAPSGPMAQDALAREVESWSRAGDSGRARSAAEQYLRAHPDGRRVNAVKKFGGIE